MAELDEIEKMEKALGADATTGAPAEQTGHAEEPDTQTEEFTRKFFLKTSGGDMVDLLDTNPLVMAARVETSSYSITPKTFQSRTFFGETESSGGEEKESLAGAVRAEEVGSSGIVEVVSGLPISARIAKTLSQIQSEIKDLEHRKLEFKKYLDEAIPELKKLSKDVIQKGDFTRIDQELQALGGKFEEKLASLQSYMRELQSFGSFVDSNQDLLLTYEDIYANDSGNNVVRFGINIASMTTNQSTELTSIYTAPVETGESLKSSKSGKSSKKSKQNDAESVKMLHPLEVIVMQDAVEHLKSSDAKTVLVDIFARNSDHSIKQEQGKPETHSVVLYKPAEEIIVVDPSDPGFSRHLAFNDLRIFRDGDKHVSILAPLREKIYVPVKGHTGPNPDQFRDCIDLATKLAFGLNMQEQALQPEEIESSDVVREVTNNTKIEEEMFFDPRDITARVRQASDDRVRIDVNKLIKTIHKQILTIELYDGNSANVREEAISKLQHEHDRYNQGILDLLDYRSTCRKLLNEAIDTYETKLVAETHSDGGE